MPGPNLTFARKKVEELMEDAIRFTWDVEGTADDEFDYGTGGVSVPVDDAEYVYDELTVGEAGRPLGHTGGYGGKCLVASVEATRSVALQIAGGARITSVPYEIWLPIDAPSLGPGAVGEVTFSKRDPGLVGREFIVRSVRFGTMQLSRILISEERERVAD